MKYFTIYLFLLFGFSVTVFAKDYQVKFLDISDGLSNNSITAIYQDCDGLNRYDGYDFKVYRNKIGYKTSLSFNTIYCIEGDSRKNICVGCVNGACVFERKKSVFHSLEYVSKTNRTETIKNSIHQIKSVSDTLVLVSSQNYGLLFFENGSYVGKQIELKTQNNKILKHNYDAKVPANDSINGCCWVYVANEGICTYANVRLPKIFADDMVLQRNKLIPIWGWADANEKIEIKFNKQIKTTKADKNGRRTIRLDSENAGGPYELIIKGKNKISIKNVLVGDVWICSG